MKMYRPQASYRPESGDLRTIGLAYGMNCPNYRQVFDVFRAYHDHADPVVRANVVLGIMYACRRFDRCDPRLIKPLLMHGLRDGERMVRDNAETVAADLKYCFKVSFGGRA